jgi:hypothetical protein
VIKFDESPKYARPRVSSDGIQDSLAVLNEEFALQEQFGPVKARGLEWMGKLSVFAQFWTRDKLTGGIVQDGPDIVSKPKT